ncbi:hypothetical protein KCU85_g1141, partial [Aureobasidium melanogenum]
MNADIGGIGIRISLYVSFLVTIFSSILGHFHQEKTAVKDIGTAQLTSMLSLAFALLRSYTALTFWQLMVAIMSLEVTSATVQMALSQKEILASRWWVVLNSASQLFVQASLAIVIGVSFPMSPAQKDPCQPCVRAVWWGTFDSCKQVPWMFWIYWSMRTLIALRSCAIGLHHMHFYDLSERVAKGETTTKKISWSNSLLQRLTLTDPIKSTAMTNSQTARITKTWSLEAFSRMPATTLTDWILWTLPAGVAISSMERMLSLYDLSKPGSITDWGQTTTFMAVILGLVARAVYLFYAKLKRRSCLERTKSSMELLKSSIARKNDLSAENFATFESKWKSFQDIRKVLEPVDCVRRKLPDQVWYEHVDLEKVEAEFLRSAELNDVNGLKEFASYIPDMSTAVDDMKRTALHKALDGNNIEAIETIMEIIAREPLPENPSTTPGKNMEKLLTAEDKMGRTPWKMIMPDEPSQMNKEVLEAFLRLKHPVRNPDESPSVVRIINMVFTLPYPLVIMKEWVKTAEETQSLNRLEDAIIQAVGSDNCNHTKEIELATESIFEFCCWQYDEMTRTGFADRLFRAFVHSPSRALVPMPPHIALRLAGFVQERRAWAIECYTEIARIVAWKCQKSLEPIKLLLEQHSKDSQIEEQILLGVIPNYRLRHDIMTMLLDEWPDQVIVTPKVLEACLADNSPCFVQLLLEKCPHQIRITDSLLMFAARNGMDRNGSVLMWNVLIEKYRSQINMTPDIFHAAVRSIGGRHPDVTTLFRGFLKEWPDVTRITSEVLLALMRNSVPGFEVMILFSNLRYKEFGAAINGEVIISMVERGAFVELYVRSRPLAQFFFKRYPDECRASITDEVLSKIENMKDGHSVANYFKAFRQGLVNDLTIRLDLRPKFLNVDFAKPVGRRTAEAIYGWNGMAGRHGSF